MSYAKLGIVVPTYKEEEIIGDLIQSLIKNVPDAQIVVVDDSPNEATVLKAKSLGLANVHVIHREGKGGRGTAVVDGIKKVLELGCTEIVEMDSDFSHHPQEMPTLIQKGRDTQAGAVIASRYMSGGEIKNWPWNRRAFSATANFILRTLLNLKISDYTNGYRYYSHAAAKIIAENCGRLGTGFIALSETLVNLYVRGLKITEVPTVFVNRDRGVSSLNLKEICNAITGISRIFMFKLKTGNSLRG